MNFPAWPPASIKDFEYDWKTAKWYFYLPNQVEITYKSFFSF